MKKLLLNINVFVRTLIISIILSITSLAQTPVGTRIDNNATMRFMDLVGNPYDEIISNTASIVVQGGGLLMLNKTVFPETAFPGDTVEFSIDVFNAGNATLYSVNVVDTLLTTLSYLSSSPSGNDDNNILTWLIDSVLIGSRQAITFNAVIDSTVSYGSSIENTVHAKDSEGTIVTASAVITIGSAANVTIKKKVSATEATAGDSLVYTIYYSNRGNISATGVVISDALPLGTQFISASPIAQTSSGVVSWFIDTIPPGYSDSVKFKVLIPYFIPQGTKLENIALISASEDISINSNTVSTYVNPSLPSLILNKTVSADTAFVGNTVTYSIYLENTGDLALDNISMRDTIPAGLTDVTVSDNASLTDGGIVIYERSVLQPSEKDSLTVTAVIDPGLPSPAGLEIINRAYVQSTQTPEQWSEAKTVIYVPILFIDKTVSADTAFVGNAITYSIYLENNGDLALDNISMRDTIPAGLTDVTVSDNATLTDGIVIYERSVLQPSEKDSLTVTAVIDPGLPSPAGLEIINRAYVQSTQTPEQWSEAKTVIYVPILFIDKTVSKDTVSVGDSLTYSILLRNNGDFTLTNITVLDTIPSQILNVTVSANSSISDGIVFYSKDYLQVSEVDTITITGIIDENLPANVAINNTAYTISDYTNLQSSSAVSVTYKESIYELQLEKIISRDTVLVGDTLHYLIRLTNIGNSGITNISLTDTIPSQLTDNRVSPNVSLIERIVTYTRDTLLPGMSDSFYVFARLLDDRPNKETIINTISGSSNEIENLTSSAILITKVIVSNASCRLAMTVDPELVIGDGKDASVITVFASDTLGNPKPDGTPIAFTTTEGYFSNNQSSIIIPTQNGFAIDSIRALIISGNIVRAIAIATANDADICSASDSVEIVFFPGAIKGIVINNTTSQPYNGAIVRVYSSTDELVGEQTTIEDGKYLIPVPKTDDYKVTITTVNTFGNSSIATTVVNVNVPGTGGNPPVPNTNSLSGTIYYLLTNQPVPVEGMKVLLSIESESSKLRKSKSDLISITPNVIDSTFTDSDGFYKFEDIEPGNYVVNFSHSTISGEKKVIVHGNGEYIIDTNIPIVLTSNIKLTKSGPSQASLNDTITYNIKVSNTAELPTTNTTIIDSLDEKMIFVSASEGGIYEPSEHTVIWNIGLFDTVERDLSIVIMFDPKIKRDTSLLNNVILTSNETDTLFASVQTDIVIPEDNLSIWKTVSNTEASVGDTLTYKIFLQLLSNNTVEHLTVTDILPEQVVFLTSEPPGFFEPTSNKLTWNIDSLVAGAVTEINIMVAVRLDLEPGEYNFNNIGTLSWPGGTISSESDSSSNAEVHTLVSYLDISKRTVKQILEVGDITTYFITVRNLSKTNYAKDLQVVDNIPFGFKYLQGSSFLENNIKITDPLGSSELVWSLSDSLGPGKSVQLVYRLVVGAGGIESDGVNYAQALGKSENGLELSSKIVKVQVEVKEGLFTSKGIVIGKVFYDDNMNAYQDEGEDGVKGIEMMMEDGTRIITGDDGKYSLPEVNPGEHVIRVRQHTLPSNSDLVGGLSDFAGDPSSRFIYLTESGIVRADFYLSRKSFELSQTIERLSLISIQKVIEPRKVLFTEDIYSLPIRIKGKNFESGKANLLPTAYRTLNEVGNLLINNEEISLVVKGHTDSKPINTKQFPSNEELSEARANSVKDYLTKTFSIDESRISTVGFGERKPIAFNTTFEGRAKNRRVELFFTYEFNKSSLEGALIEFKIPIRYVEGRMNITRIKIKDEFSESIEYIEGSGKLGTEKVNPVVNGKKLIWTIEKVADNYNKELKYVVRITKSQYDSVFISSISEVSFYTGDSLFYSKSLETQNLIQIIEPSYGVNFIFSDLFFEMDKSNFRDGIMPDLEEIPRRFYNMKNPVVIIELPIQNNLLHTNMFSNEEKLIYERVKNISNLLISTYGINSEKIYMTGENDNVSGYDTFLRDKHIIQLKIIEKKVADRFINKNNLFSTNIFHRFLSDKEIDLTKDSILTVRPGEIIGIQLNVENHFIDSLSQISLVDSISSELKVIENSISTLKGITNFIVEENIIKADCNNKAEIFELFFITEVTNRKNSGGLIKHQFVVEQKLHDGRVNKFTSYPLYMKIIK
ncbi:OmpA family protein [Bacteroidota bacterium]